MRAGVGARSASGGTGQRGGPPPLIGLDHAQDAGAADELRDSRFYRWGFWAAGHPKRVLGAWLIVLVAAGGLAVVFLSRLGGTNFSVPGSDSAKARQLIADSFPSAPAERDLVVFHSSSMSAGDKAFHQAVSAALKSVQGRDLVLGTISPYDAPQRLISQDRHTALAVLSLGGTARQRQAAAGGFEDALSQAAGSRVQAHLTGTSPINAALVSRENSDLRLAEGGRHSDRGSGAAAGLRQPDRGGHSPWPLGIAGVSRRSASSERRASARPGTCSSSRRWRWSASRWGSTTRCTSSPGSARSGTAGRSSTRRSAARWRPAGKAVAFSGTTVLVSLSGLLLVNASFFRQMGYGVILAAVRHAGREPDHAARVARPARRPDQRAGRSRSCGRKQGRDDPENGLLGPARPAGDAPAGRGAGRRRRRDAGAGLPGPQHHARLQPRRRSAAGTSVGTGLLAGRRASSRPVRSPRPRSSCTTRPGRCPRAS